jgi:hypothetical protein
MPQVNQRLVLHLSNSITYFLRAEECHKSISNMSCTCQTASLTSWGQKNATGSSATCPAPVKQHHLLPGCRGMPQVHEQHVLHLSNSITYSLSAEECHKYISNMSCTCQTTSLTSCGQRNATSPSATCPPPVKQHHLHTGTEECHMSISNMSSTCQTTLLTSWVQRNATSPSATCPPPVKQHHLHTVGRGMPQVHEQHVLHLSNSITYFLRAEECHKSISNMSCTC